MENPDPIHLLFVDDDTGYMAVAQHILAKYATRKFTVVWRQDGTSALEFLKTRPPVDLVILDYYLPEMNGLELAKALRERHPDLPLMFLTSNRDFRLAIEAMKYGVEDYMVKDEAVDSVLPRMIINIVDRVRLKRRIAEQQKAELIASQRAEAIRQLVVTVCHEFNNPLAAIKISTDILLRQSLPSDERVRAEEIDRNISRVEAEITRLRDMNFDKPDFRRSE
jgi:DNA-binding NtrC family response regulator